MKRYTSDYAEKNFRAYCQEKILYGLYQARFYPVCYLERKSAKECVPMAIEASFYDDNK